MSLTIQPQSAPDAKPLLPFYAPDSMARPLMPGAEPFLYDAGDEVGCLLVHGFTATPAEMRGVGRYLADKGITAGGVLLAGHGTAPEDLQSVTWRDWYASVKGALDDMQARCNRVYLAGLSLGGALTLYTAAKRGKDLAGIISMAAPIYLPPGLRLVLKGMRTHVPYIYKASRDIEDPIAREGHIGYLSTSTDAIATLVELLGEVRAALPQVKVPTLIIYSRRDHIVPPISSHHIYSRINTSDKRMIALHRGSHVVTTDYDRDRVYAAVHEFISKRESGL
ncbi:MAG TPA: alpha/beta fold hydrolase [Chloroflexia bacterium]|nr:alpha/beta fold hydrolase [Chloroflexia bacterium]